MIKRFKSVSLLLAFSVICTGVVSATENATIASDMEVTQQKGACTGVVKDATGETIIGASVVVKGTTNGTITGIDGDFYLTNVKKGGGASGFLCRLPDSRGDLSR